MPSIHESRSTHKENPKQKRHPFAQAFSPRRLAQADCFHRRAPVTQERKPSPPSSRTGGAS